jgi:hypothetical protein
MDRPSVNILLSIRLALATMTEVVIPASAFNTSGNYQIVVSGTVKDNSGTGSISFTASKNIHVTTPGCGGG